MIMIDDICLFMIIMLVIDLIIMIMIKIDILIEYMRLDSLIMTIWLID